MYTDINKKDKIIKLIKHSFYETISIKKNSIGINIKQIK